MEGKMLDLDAPIISVRRINASSVLSKDAKPQSRRGLLRSGHVEHGGAVPFIWEKMPGHPKENSGEVVGPVVGGSTAAPYIPPDRIMINASRPKHNAVGTQMPITCSSDCGTEKLITERVGFNPADFGDERDAFSDSRDTLSCNESFSIRSGFTGLSACPSLTDSNGQFFKDLQMEEDMMGRFLPAAQAMVSGSSQRKPPRAPAVDKYFERKTLPRTRLPLHYHYHFSVSASSGNSRKEEVEDVEEEEESDEIVSHESTGYFSSKARRLISRFGLKSPFFLLKPVPGMKVRDLSPMKLGRMSNPRITVSNDEGTVEDDSWEAVCRHRLMNLDYIQKDFDSKLTTESNQLTCGIDSQTPDSSSFQHSSVDNLSTNKTADVKSKSKTSKTGSLDSGKGDIGSYWEMASSIGRLQGFVSTSPATDRTHINSSQLLDTSDSTSRVVSMTAGTKENTDSGYALLSEFQRSKECILSQTSGRCQLQSKFSRSTEPCKTLNCEDKKGNGFSNSQSNEGDFDLKGDGQKKNIENSLTLSLLPPPLPKSSSDSWLQRTLACRSEKGPNQRPFLGIQFHPIKQAFQASRGAPSLTTLDDLAGYSSKPTSEASMVQRKNIDTWGMGSMGSDGLYGSVVLYFIFGRCYVVGIELYNAEFSILILGIFLWKQCDIGYDGAAMDLQNTAFTVQLGRGANIQLANAVINTRSSRATIQFGSVDFPAVVARAAVTSAYGTDPERPARRPHSAETSARHAHLSASRVTTTQDPPRRISVFERISQSEAPATQRVVTGGRVSVVTANTTTLPTGMSVPGKNNTEASSSGGRLTRRQRRKMNAQLRAQQQQVPVHPSNLPAQELEANVPTRNKFTDLKWVKRNSSTGELKKSFWD
ncbi:hypothetical protein M5K25_024532 [Dendrobium thyrsiflorum]|uniref:Uncharacterized protein n=1 Tax=Dendrobium thyrsiflorum TaxID=117978 RepID=A0ABD0U2L4_DENTH